MILERAIPALPKRLSQWKRAAPSLLRSFQKRRR